MYSSYLEEFFAAIIAALLGCWTEQAPQTLPPDLPDRFVNSIGMEMQFVPAGTFIMGSDEDFGYDGIELRPFAPAHEVSVDAFYMARFELTVAQFEEFAYDTGIAEKNPDYNTEIDHTYGFPSGNPAHPIQSIDWYTARDFCVWLSEREGIEYRLPREAEWEYVASAGNHRPLLLDENGMIFRFFEYCASTRGAPFLAIAPSGSFAMNPWGFYDMLGNAPEWVEDWYSFNYDPYDCYHNPDGPWWGPLLKGYKIRRAGGTQLSNLDISSCNPIFRKPVIPTDQYGAIRLLCSIDENFVPYSGNEIGARNESLALPAQLVEPDRVYEIWELAPSVELKMVWIPPGEFIFGTSADSARGKASRYEQPRIPAVFTEGFFMGVYEVTNEQYGAMIDDHVYPEGKDAYPVEGIKMEEAHVFAKYCERNLRSQGLLTDEANFDLPSDLEWEYACRAGTASDYFFGDDPRALDYYGWADYLLGVQPVGQKLPNPWGLYDMYGNVAEYCYGNIQRSYERLFNNRRPLPIINPRTGLGGGVVIIRGGSWAMMPHRARSSARHTSSLSQPFPLAGFRLVRRLGPDENPPTPNIDPESIKTYPVDKYPWEELHPGLSRY